MPGPTERKKVFPKFDYEGPATSDVLADLVHAIHKIDEAYEEQLTEARAAALKKMCEQHARDLPRIGRDDLMIGLTLYPITYPGIRYTPEPLVVRTNLAQGPNMLEIRVSASANTHPATWTRLELADLPGYISAETAEQFQQWIEEKKKEIASVFALNGHTE